MIDEVLSFAKTIANVFFLYAMQAQANPYTHIQFGMCVCVYVRAYLENKNQTRIQFSEEHKEKCVNLFR